MRLDARTGDKNWQCYDCERAALIHDVTWVDEGSATWGEPDFKSIAGRLHLSLTGNLLTIKHYEKRIKICVDGRIVLFNPLDDVGEIETVREIIVGELAPSVRREHAR